MSHQTFIQPSHLTLLKQITSIVKSACKDTVISQVDKPELLGCYTKWTSSFYYYINQNGEIEGIKINSTTPVVKKVLEICKDITDTLKHLYFESLYIKDLEIFKNFTNLETLDIINYPNNWLSALAEYSSGKSLRHGTLEDLKAITELKNLKTLKLRGQKIRDLQPLRKMKNLKSLDLSYNFFEDIEPLSELAELKRLNLCVNKSIGNFEPLANLTKLKTLLLSSTAIGRYPGQMEKIFAELTSLQVLYLDNCELKDISALKKLRNLKILKLNKNNIRDIEPLRELHNLEELYLSGNPVSNIEPLRELVNLKKLDITSTGIKTKPAWLPQNIKLFV